MVRIHPDPPRSCLVRWPSGNPWDLCMTGGLAQLGEHLLCKQGVVGSIPSSSTNPQCLVFWCIDTSCYALAIEPVRVICGYGNCDIGCRSLTIRKK